jgi:hypothetical protein
MALRRLARARKHGREPLWDCVDAKKYLATLPYVDANRVGIIGGSYGGYMVLAALAYQPDVFDVGVDIFCVSNWLRTRESMPAWWEAQRTMKRTDAVPASSSCRRSTAPSTRAWRSLPAVRSPCNPIVLGTRPDVPRGSRDAGGGVG